MSTADDAHHSKRQPRHPSGQFKSEPWRPGDVAALGAFRRHFNGAPSTSVSHALAPSKPVSIGWTVICVSPMLGVQWDDDPTRPYN